MRAYFPENAHIVYLILGSYAALVTLAQIRGSFAKSAAIAALPAPEFPDYHTPSACAAAAAACAGAAPPRSLPLPRLTHALPLRLANRITRAYPLPVVVSSGELPSFGSPEWEAFIASDPKNFEVWVEVRPLVSRRRRPRYPPLTLFLARLHFFPRRVPPRSKTRRTYNYCGAHTRAHAPCC